MRIGGSSNKWPPSSHPKQQIGREKKQQIASGRFRVELRHFNALCIDCQTKIGYIYQCMRSEQVNMRYHMFCMHLKSNKLYVQKWRDVRCPANTIPVHKCFLPGIIAIFKGTSQTSLRRVDTMVMARKDPKEVGWCWCTQEPAHSNRRCGSPTTIFYRLVSEPLAMLVGVCHHPKRNSPYFNGGWLPGCGKMKHPSCIYTILHQLQNGGGKTFWDAKKATLKTRWKSVLKTSHLH